MGIGLANLKGETAERRSYHTIDKQGRVNVGSWASSFMGTASTLVAASRCDRNSIGVEIDPGYFRQAQARMNAEVATLIDPRHAIAVGGTARHTDGRFAVGILHTESDYVLESNPPA